MIRESLLRLDAYVRSKNHKGHDPYDLLASKLPLNVFGTKLCYYLTQVNKRDPYRILRTALAIPEQYVPKGVALFIESYSKWRDIGLDDQKDTILSLKSDLDDLRAPGYDDKFCWGLNYAYATSLKYVPTLYPSVVVTAYAHRAYYEAMQHYPELDYQNQLESSVRFLLEDLERTEEDGGLCFSYYTVKKDIVYNANAKAGEMLARMYHLNGNEEYLKLATQVMDHTLANQKEDGRWNYRKLDDGSERAQIDFHQLFIIECLQKFIAFAKPTDEKYRESIDRGLEFFLKNQLVDEQYCKYRWPKEMPIDIHNQASTIIALCRLSELKPELIPIAEKVAKYTISNMQLDHGGFAYQKNGARLNQTSYIRWCNAWMHLALTTLLGTLQRPLRQANE